MPANNSVRQPALRIAHRRVTFLPIRPDAREHELVVQRMIAARLAALFGCEFDDGTDPAHPTRTATIGYAVPNETITSLAAAQTLGLNSEQDLFGGVVPYPFVATKTITHPLVGPDAQAPPGWQPQFAQRVREVVLPGRSAFSVEDARAACRQMLAHGAIRLKLASGVGGNGQSIAQDAAQADAQLAALEPAGLADGLVIELNLSQVRTFSVGLLRIGSLQAGYVGTQRTTRSRNGTEVYGGSTITVARGGLNALEQRLDASDDERLAIRQARVYHEAALASFAGMFASRCNYDIAQGRDAAGQPCSGVLEQSWRIGGASGAEIAAIEALCDDPGLQLVRASTVEVHAPQVAVPEGAITLFSGHDDLLGPITKYAQVHDDAGSRAKD